MAGAISGEHIGHVGVHHAVLVIAKADREKEATVARVRRAYAMMATDAVDEIHRCPSHDEHRFKILDARCRYDRFDDAMSFTKAELGDTKETIVVVSAVGEAFGIVGNAANFAKRGLLVFALNRRDLQHVGSLSAVKSACFFNVLDLLEGKLAPFTDRKAVELELSDGNAVEALDGQIGGLAHLSDLTIPSLKKLH